MTIATPGRAVPIGATVDAGGVNFCLHSKHATGVTLQLFDRPEDAQPAHEVVLDPVKNRTYDYWHVHLAGVGSGQLYGYRVDGPFNPAVGLRFDATKLLVDPYAREIANLSNYRRTRAIDAGDNAASALKSVVVDPAAYDWEGDHSLQRPYVDSVIYEMHVAGFTKHPTSGVAVAKRGTYAGLIEKIPYLQQLGVMTVELMPAQQFDPQDAPSGVNYWGYQPVAWFAPHAAYSSGPSPLAAVDEFRDLVKALHRADIEVILDVVFNHTAEGNEIGPTLSWRGLDNEDFYIHAPNDLARYIDDTGCGNTVNANNPVARRMILDCLRYWVTEMHVDGFRFDLAASLSRRWDGAPLARAPILYDIESDPVLAGTKLIAEAWDAGGLYSVGHFAGDRWGVWNGRYRDVVRRFVKGDAGIVGSLADCLVGSRNLFHETGRNPDRSVNYVTAHDGFTLNDLVSYDAKHNQANGENNSDGTDDNFSWNCGAEGPTEDAAVESLRQRQAKNLLTILFLSEGRPMLVMGDEVRRTQQGNNNPYCQDNELSWFDWDDLERHADLLRFTRELIAFHQRTALFRSRPFWSEPGAPQITWHGVELNQPDWGEGSHALAYELVGPDGAEHLYVAFNAYWESLEFALPSLPQGAAWRRLIDTALESPNDISSSPISLTTGQRNYRCEARSSLVLIKS
ncbi:glycogen debranching protein GlgX [Lacipirellula limnantheis]|uniref:Glycogen debranching enzyme n=1 Tax=Lacipirellula limnantheis TaxID=2528024 RepID=A0A517U4M0_9BACT|nr:glycogen debranching protein GlgX [Lacipirellula limnantheis]QDT75589.1 Glycogen debranching enzyme [Lacipirellula limnantheis]